MGSSWRGRNWIGGGGFGIYSSPNSRYSVRVQPVTVSLNSYLVFIATTNNRYLTVCIQDCSQILTCTDFSQSYYSSFLRQSLVILTGWSWTPGFKKSSCPSLPNSWVSRCAPWQPATSVFYYQLSEHNEPQRLRDAVKCSVLSDSKSHHFHLWRLLFLVHFSRKISIGDSESCDTTGGGERNT